MAHDLAMPRLHLLIRFSRSSPPQIGRQRSVVMPDHWQSPRDRLPPNSTCRISITPADMSSGLVACLLCIQCRPQAAQRQVPVGRGRTCTLQKTSPPFQPPLPQLDQ
jgi:hypothetical protein